MSDVREQLEENLNRWRFFSPERRQVKVSRSETEYMWVNETETSAKMELQ